MLLSVQIPVSHCRRVFEQDPVLVCGRVVIDPSEGAKKLDRTSIMLEGDMAFSSGARVKLDVSELKEFFFFPGQVCCSPHLPLSTAAGFLSLWYWVCADAISARHQR